jgi:hypothetical protein
MGANAAIVLICACLGENSFYLRAAMLSRGGNLHITLNLAYVTRLRSSCRIS